MRGGQGGGASGGRAAERGPGGDVSALGAVLEALQGERALAEGMALGRLTREWARVVGERLAAECAPAALRGGTLLVAASSGAWAGQLRFLAREVAARANEVLEGEAVREVRVVVEAPGWGGPVSKRPGPGG